MLISLNPGLKCKACKDKMTIAKEIPGSVNMVLKEGRMIAKGDFTCNITCQKCMTMHVGEAFLRDGVFMGVYKYQVSLDSNLEGPEVL
tara:strand:- start:3359 stop:3622 length:264 start_codon:yes stop_codon:yes gene_type:complete